MIVRMKKLTLLCLASDRERTLERLRELGALHIEHVREPAGTDLDDLTGQMERMVATTLTDRQIPI